MSCELLIASWPSSIIASQLQAYELSALSYELFFRNPILDPDDGAEVGNLFI